MEPFNLDKSKQKIKNGISWLGVNTWNVLRQSFVGIVVALAVIFIALLILGFPGEDKLRQENELLHSQLELLNKRADASVAVMEDVIDRDNNFYRVMMQADPINNAQRYAGLERQRLYGILDSMPDADLLKSVTSKLDRLDRQIYSQIKSFDQLKELVGKNKDRLAHIPAIQPISEVNLKQMASGYGYRRDPIYGVSRFHEGMDFAADTGTPVYATGDGRVAEAGWKSGYGNAIDINHGYNYVTRYAHLSQILVKPGQEVKRGDLIGKVGNTGKSTGSHLHYEVRFNGEAQNPIDYYYYDLTPEQYDQMIRMANNAGHVMD
jgi:murein DD-endopeptidase MepM/ murein hydrolase activator NlpD